MSSPIFDSTFGTGRFRREEPMTTSDQSQAAPTSPAPSPEPQDVREAALKAARICLMNRDQSPMEMQALALINAALAQSDAERKGEESKMSGEAKAIYDTLDTYTDIEDVKRVARGWMDAAAQHLRNEEYYRGVCHEIGETLFGREAHIQDDGGYSESVLVAKLPELAKAAAGTDRERVAEMLRSYAADRSVHGEAIPDCPTEGVAARQGNGG